MKLCKNCNHPIQLSNKKTGYIHSQRDREDCCCAICSFDESRWNRKEVNCINAEVKP